LFGIDTHIVGGHEDDFHFSFDYNKFKEFLKENNHVLTIAPPPISTRIAAQHSILLCSKLTDGKYGSLYLNDDDKYYKFIAISPELKKQCVCYLRNCFDITRPTMFADFAGFCEMNSVKWERYAHDRW